MLLFPPPINTFTHLRVWEKLNNDNDNDNDNNNNNDNDNDNDNDYDNKQS